MQQLRFHSHHGQNIHISEDGLIATRTCSFAHGICFGDRPLNQGEIFLVEILQNESGWSGHLRLGLTQHNPNTGFELPQYALPDFVTLLGKSWVMAITKTQKFIFRDDDELPDLDQDPGSPPRQSILGRGEWIRTRCGTVRRTQLLPQAGSAEAAQLGKLVISEIQTTGSDGSSVGSPSVSDVSLSQNCTILPTEVSSRIGMVFTCNGRKGDLYIIVNGEEYGPMAKDIPLNDGPLWPVVDVYGTTKQVRMVHLTINESLQTRCRDKILQQLKDTRGINSLPLPTKLRKFLKYES